MNKLISIGELIIDFASEGVSELKNTEVFRKKPGGACANVCCQVSKNCLKAVYVSKVGNDAFGEFLIETLKNENVETKYIKKSDDHHTSLAFVSFLENGERQFSFFRKNAADLYFTLDDVSEVVIEEGDIFHFGSVALKTKESRTAHDYLINKAIENKALITFDPNVRLNLWENHNELRNIINEYIQYANILKISDDELTFITGINNEEEAIAKLFVGNVKIVVLTRGSKGATLYLDGKVVANHSGYKVKALDTTGAGDSFFGGFITKLLMDNRNIGNLLENIDFYNQYLKFACKCGAYTTLNYGAISAMGNSEEIERVIGE